MKARGGTSSVRRIAFRIGSIFGLLCASSMAFVFADPPAEDQSRSLSVPVIIGTTVQVSGNAEREVPAASTPVAQPTLPGGKLPQYQLIPRLLSIDTDELIESPKLRFLLALPNEPILIEATITIDGQPFRHKREQRVQETLKAALQEPGESESLGEIKVASEAPVDDSENRDESPLRADRLEELAESVSPNAYYSAASTIEKLKRYISSIGREPSVTEVRWFFVHRVDGPTLLLLRDSFQAFRADQTPLFHVLDRNRDGVISSEEINQSVESFLDCDLNRNEVVDYLELNETANDPRLKRGLPFATNPLLQLIPEEQRAGEVYAELLSAYENSSQPAVSLGSKFDANTNGMWEPEELNHLRTMPADVQLTIQFDTATPGNSSVTIPETTLATLDKQSLSATIVGSSIVLSREDCDVWFQANQFEASDQISIGAVKDGYPMLPVLDPNDDGRFTLRELRGLAESLKQFDRNQDGQILKDELRQTIRVAFGMGPHVHQTLAGIRSVNSSPKSAVSGPEWFVRMDVNKDGDLTRKEFPGTDEQFKLLNPDGDEFISTEEALEYDRKTAPKPAQTESPKVIEVEEKQPADRAANNDN